MELLNRQELCEYMNNVAENIRDTSCEEQNKLVLEKIEKIFEYMNGKGTIRLSVGATCLTPRQIVTFLTSMKLLEDNRALNSQFNPILDSYFEMADFVHDCGNTARPILTDQEYEILNFQLERIANKIKNIK